MRKTVREFTDAQLRFNRPTMIDLGIAERVELIADNTNMVWVNVDDVCLLRIGKVQAIKLDTDELRRLVTDRQVVVGTKPRSSESKDNGRFDVVVMNRKLGTATSIEQPNALVWLFHGFEPISSLRFHLMKGDLAVDIDAGTTDTIGIDSKGRQQRITCDLIDLLHGMEKYR